MGVFERIFNRVASTETPGWPMPSDEEVARSLAPRAPQSRYEGASKGRRGARWKTDNRTPKQETRLSLPELVRRSRDQFKNTPWARRGVSLIAINAIGTGISVKLTPARGAQRSSDRIKLWLNSVDLDVAGRRHYAGMQRLGVQMMVRDGTVFFRRLRMREPKSGLLLRLQMLSVDWLDTSKDGVQSADSVTVNGIEYDSKGQRLAYWFKTALTDDLFSIMKVESIRVPAEDVIALYRQDEEGQDLGIPWLAPALWTLKDSVEYQDAQLIKQKLASALMAKKTMSGGGALPGEVDGDDSQPATDEIEPGTTVYLRQGEDFDFVMPPSVDGFGEVIKLSARQVAVSLPVPYYMLAGDVSDANYSSGRLEWHVFNDSIEQLQWDEVIPHFNDRVMGWAIEAELLPPEAIAYEHTTPRRRMLDESKEVPPIIKKVRAGLMSRQEAIRALGYDPEEVDREIKEDNDRADALGLSFDSDGRRPESGPAPDQLAPDDNTDTATTNT
jgi:lambda family phage portal protein